MYKHHLQAIRQELIANKIDGVILTHSPIVRWATGLSSSNALVYVSGSTALLVTDGRYAESAHQQVTTAEVVIGQQTSLAMALAQALGEGTNSLHALGFQSDRMLVSERDDIAAAFPNCQLTALTGFLQEAVAIKSAEEINAIAQAQKITDAVFSELLEIIKPGMTEKELAAEVVYRQLQHGADTLPDEFWPIVASGPNSALPHAHPTDRKIAAQDVVMLDFGCTVNGYCSDMTRTVAVGEPSSKFRSVYETVLKAQAAGLAAAKAGVVASAVDATARDLIAAAGYELPHGLGHSLGLDIHEWPALNQRNHAKLPNQAIVTIEPGIYLPGEFGIRIEDMVVLEPDGCRNLTASPKELIIL